VTASGIALNDKVCQGDPTVYDPFAISPDRDSPVIALRRTYRGLVQRVVDGNTIYETQGIADAAVIEGQDFVFTRLQPALTAGSNCVGTNRPMTRSDSGAGTLFAGVPGDFVCLNDDNLNADGDPVSDGQPDYLDSYQSPWTANVGCQFDPTDPPVLSHQISGTIAITGGPLLNLSGLQVISSDGVDNCVLGSFTGTLIDPLDPLAGANYTASYICNVFDWGTGWSGLVHLEPNSTQLFCDNSTVAFSNVTANQTLHFSCESSATTLIQGTLQYTTNTDPIGGITIEDAGGIETGFCVILSGAYRCLLPYTGATVTAHIDVDSDDVVCGSVTGMNGLIEVAGASAASSPVRRDILIAQRTNQCP
jgi:hypothetical protein